MSGLPEIVCFESYLQKKSSNLLVGYQQRYFKLHSDGALLGYYKDKPNLQDKPQGVIHLQYIEAIDIKDNSNQVTIKYGKREFELKAESVQLAEQWVDILSPLAEYYHNYEKQNIKESKDIDSNLMNAMQLENERQILEETDFSQRNQEENQKILKEIELQEYLAQLDRDVLANRIMMGMLTKQEKNLVQFKRKWLLLISPRSLSDCKDNQPMIFPEQLPPWCELDHLYVFQESQGKWEYDLKIDLQEVTELSVNDVSSNAKEQVNLTYFIDDLFKVFDKDRSKTSDFYSFKIATKKNSHVFFTDFVTDLNKWVGSLGSVINREQPQAQSQYQSQEQNKINESNQQRSMSKDKIEIRFSTGMAYESQQNQKIEPNIDFTQLKSIPTDEDNNKRIGRAMTMDQGALSRGVLVPAEFEGYVRLRINSDFINQYAEQYIRITKKSLLVYISHTDSKHNEEFQLEQFNHAYEYKDNRMRLQSKNTKILMTFMLKDQQQRDQWMFNINHSIDQTRGILHSMEADISTSGRMQSSGKGKMRTQSLQASDLMMNQTFDKSQVYSVLQQDVIEDESEYSDDDNKQESNKDEPVIQDGNYLISQSIIQAKIDNGVPNIHQEYNRMNKYDHQKPPKQSFWNKVFGGCCKQNDY